MGADGVSPRMNTIFSRDQCKPIRLGEKFSGELSRLEIDSE